MTSWYALAACRGKPSTLFFPERGCSDISEALAYCAGCPVRSECLAEALSRRDPGGIWGGTTEKERRRMRRTRRVAA